MSQRIVTECDECMALGETRPASTVGVRALSIEVEVDLCDVHVKPLADLLARLVEVGRAPGAATGSAVCPRCGRRFATHQALGRHAIAAHGKSVRELRGQSPRKSRKQTSVEGGIPCPECGREFGKPQGLAVHRRRIHGVSGSSTSTASRRRSSGEGPGGG